MIIIGGSDSAKTHIHSESEFILLVRSRVFNGYLNSSRRSQIAIGAQ
jgi:hypothetical protein